MTASPAFACSTGVVRLLPQADCRELPLWSAMFDGAVKDHRYYEVIEDTLHADFDCRVLAIYDHSGELQALQPCFFVEQDLIATAPAPIRTLVARLRRHWPRLLTLRMLMIGCAAGAGHVVATKALPALQETLPEIARRNGALLIVWKDLPSTHRADLSSLTGNFTRVASMPATLLELGASSFDDYLARTLSHSMRKNLRRKFRALATAPPLDFTVATSLAGVVDEAHGLYLQVFTRAQLRFEKLTPEFLLELERRMPDRARFFLWRQEGRLVAFSLCLVHDGVLYDEYLGLDYRVALDLHLYFVTFRDVLSWAMANGLRAYHSTPLNYDPKLHLGFRLVPLDLYVAPTASWARPLMRLVLPWIQPTRAEPVLREFSNAAEL
jgi:hypothetical protein